METEGRETHSSYGRAGTGWWLKVGEKRPEGDAHVKPLGKERMGLFIMNEQPAAAPVTAAGKLAFDHRRVHPPTATH